MWWKAMSRSTAPMSDPENYQYDIDVSEVVTRKLGVVVLLLVANFLTLPLDVLRRDGELSKFDGGVSDSGEEPLDC